MRVVVLGRNEAGSRSHYVLRNLLLCVAVMALFGSTEKRGSL